MYSIMCSLLSDLQSTVGYSLTTSCRLLCDYTYSPIYSSLLLIPIPYRPLKGLSFWIIRDLVTGSLGHFPVRILNKFSPHLNR